MPDGRRCLRQSRNEAPSCRDYDTVRGCIDHIYRPKDKYARALLGDRRASANSAALLHGIFGHEPCSVFSAATTEHGTLGVAARRSGNIKRRRDCPKLPILGTWPVLRGLPHHLRRNALDDLAALRSQVRWHFFRNCIALRHMIDAVWKP